ncbi:MAG: LysR family transcriptional regulator [Ramlibacter sp.]|nr:LysR family transcriptional regulator [Ramlibacter sp.]
MRQFPNQGAEFMWIDVDAPLKSIRKIRRVLPPLNSVKVFETVARLGSQTRAARELNVTPSAINQQMRVLEEFIGRKLFLQSNQGLELTDNGRLVYSDVSAAMDLIAHAFMPPSPCDC